MGSRLRARAARSAPTDGAPAHSTLRLTRRARRLAVVLALCGGVVLGSWLAPLFSGGADEGLHLAGVSSVVVEPGTRRGPSPSRWPTDVRAVIDRIQELNGLDGADSARVRCCSSHEYRPPAGGVRAGRDVAGTAATRGW